MGEWQAGDLALCVDGEGESARVGRGVKTPTFFMLGGLYIVRSVEYGGAGLTFDGKPSGHPSDAWRADCFKKVPPHSADEFDREVIELMSRAPMVAGAGR